MSRIHRFFKITCTNITSRGRLCLAPLGDIQVDTSNSSRRYCRSCKHLMEYQVDADGRVTKEVLPRDYRVQYDESIAVVEVRHGSR